MNQNPYLMNPLQQAALNNRPKWWDHLHQMMGTSLYVAPKPSRIRIMRTKREYDEIAAKKWWKRITGLTKELPK